VGALQTPHSSRALPQHEKFIATRKLKNNEKEEKTTYLLHWFFMGVSSNKLL
jgi:hypothetical protein